MLRNRENNVGIVRSSIIRWKIACNTDDLSIEVHFGNVINAAEAEVQRFTFRSLRQTEMFAVPSITIVTGIPLIFPWGRDKNLSPFRIIKSNACAFLIIAKFKFPFSPEIEDCFPIFCRCKGNKCKRQKKNNEHFYNLFHNVRDDFYVNCETIEPDCQSENLQLPLHEGLRLRCDGPLRAERVR